MPQNRFIIRLWLIVSFCLIARYSEGAIDMDWKYDAIRRLALVAEVSYPMNTRPLSQEEMSCIIWEIDKNKGTSKWPEHLELLLKRLKQENQGRIFLAATNADRDGLSLFNNYGQRYQQGLNLSANMTLHGKCYDICPQVEVNQDGVTTGLKYGYLNYSRWHTSLQAGRIPHWWGPGQNGAWLFTTNAPTFDQLRITNQQAQSLPWLGRLKYDFLLGRLSSQKIVAYGISEKEENPRFIGLRFDCTPSRYMELGIGEVCMLSGRDDGLGLKDYLQAIFPSSNTTVEETTHGPITNRIASLDVTFKIPTNHRLLKGAEVYWEYGGEDCNPNRWGMQFLSAPANLFGLYLDTGATDMRLEYGEDEDEVVWYTHSNFTKGYRHKGLIPGHHMSESKNWWLRISHPVTPNQIGVLEAEMINEKLSGISLGCLDSWKLKWQQDETGNAVTDIEWSWGLKM
ncbi:MAG: capsule assembly Wzi family protein [Candidatus Desantisbacteria bacterium]